MSGIEQLQLLIQKEQERGDELAEQITKKNRLLEEAEDQKLAIMRKMLQQQLGELKEENIEEGTEAD